MREEAVELSGSRAVEDPPLPIWRHPAPAWDPGILHCKPIIDSPPLETGSTLVPLGPQHRDLGPPRQTSPLGTCSHSPACLGLLEGGPACGLMDNQVSGRHRTVGSTARSRLGRMDAWPLYQTTALHTPRLHLASPPQTSALWPPPQCTAALHCLATST